VHEKVVKFYFVIIFGMVLLKLYGSIFEILIRLWLVVLDYSISKNQTIVKFWHIVWYSYGNWTRGESRGVFGVNSLFYEKPILVENKKECKKVIYLYEISKKGSWFEKHLPKNHPEYALELNQCCPNFFESRHTLTVENFSRHTFCRQKYFTAHQ